MIYKAIGLMSGSSLDGLDIAFVEFQEKGGNWKFEILAADCMEYDRVWIDQLSTATNLTAEEYLLLDTAYGELLGEKVNEFIDKNLLHHQVNIISSHGHTTFHIPEKKMTHQLGDGAALAAKTRLPVVSALRSMDVAFGGQGAPIVPIGEKLLFNSFRFFLNIGGIANISIHTDKECGAFDVCAANRVLNMLANEKDLSFDKNGQLASAGNVNTDLLAELNNIDYYLKLPPKSLANSFGINLIYPLIKSYGLSIEDALCTYVEHICIQIKNSLEPYFLNTGLQQLMITGGGAFNSFLIQRLKTHLAEINFEVFIPDNLIVEYKEALIMALLGILRWREQNTVMASVTGASQDSIGGALWLGTEA